MPELPEVENVKRGLEHALDLSTECSESRNSANSVRVLHADLFRPDLRFPFPRKLKANLTGASLFSIRRRAKYLLFHFDRGVLLSHLGMTGSWRLQSADGPLLPHDHLRIQVESVSTGDRPMALVFRDPRRFGYVDWISSAADLEDNKFLRALGPEPLTDKFSGEGLYRKVRKSQSTIKALLMNSTIVVGVGNIYASEALFRSGVRPSTRGSRLTVAHCEAIARSVRDVLSAAIESGGSTIRSYVGADGKSGSFQDQLMVYVRAGDPCRLCGAKIKRLVIAGRSTYFCPKCQT